MPWHLSDEGREKLRMTARKNIALRIELTAASVEFLEECAKTAHPGTCIVCGEPNPYCLDNHHPFTKSVDPRTTVLLCASCHRITDKHGRLDMLKERRERLLELNQAFWL